MSPKISLFWLKKSWENRNGLTLTAMYHKPVLLEETIGLLGIKPGGIYVDATFGGGGHSREILRHLGDGKLIGFDQDEDSQVNRPDDPRFTLVNHNFRFLRNFLRLHKLIPVDGVLADLGISSHQIDEPGRGFSTRSQGVLDMRMDRRKNLTAKTIVNTWPEEKLAGLFIRYGEIRNARKLASRIALCRSENEINTTAGLVQIARSCAAKRNENKYLAQVFQALRIEVNQETDALRDFLKQCPDLLREGGRLAVISYHSLEDKMVKNFLKTGNVEGVLSKDFFGNVISPFRVITRKAVMPGEKEVLGNSRARSARLRVGERR